jgi:hypothetical protein
MDENHLMLSGDFLSAKSYPKEQESKYSLRQQAKNFFFFFLSPTLLFGFLFLSSDFMKSFSILLSVILFLSLSSFFLRERRGEVEGHEIKGNHSSCSWSSGSSWSSCSSPSSPSSSSPLQKFLSNSFFSSSPL